MLRSRLAALMVLAGVLLVLASVGLLSSVVADWEQANGSLRLRKLTVNVDPSASAAAAAGFTGMTVKEAEQFAKQWSPLPIAYAAKAQTNATFGTVSVRSSVLGVNGNYRHFTGLKLIAGTTIGQSSVDDHSRVAVIGAQLADKLFHTGQVVGMKLMLYGVAFTVIGVFDDDGSLLKQMADDGIPDMFIPVTAMQDIDPASRVGTFQLAAKPDAALRGEADAKQALRALGHNPAQFRIENDVLIYARISQLRPLLLFGCGAIAIALLVRLIVRQLSEAYRLLGRRLAASDWADAVISERLMLLRRTVAALGMAVCAAGLWELIRFRLYIPPDWVPEMIIDVSFYTDKLRTLWQQQTAQAGYVPSPQELLAASASRLACTLLFAGAAFGLPLFLLGVRLWTAGGVSVSVQLQRLFLFIPAAAFIAFAAARWAGVDYRIDPLDYAVTGAFFIVAMIHSNHSKGGNIPYVETYR